MSSHRIRIWNGYYDEYPDKPDETITVEAEHAHLWQDDPWYSGKGAFDIHPEDAPATLYIYTNDSVREPYVEDGRFEKSQWDGPIERGLPFDPDSYDEYPPFGCEVWGRVLFWVEGGLTR